MNIQGFCSGMILQFTEGMARSPDVASIRVQGGDDSLLQRGGLHDSAL